MEMLQLRKKLQNKISGKILYDKEILNYYSVDASSYQVIPKIVVIPNNEKDVIDAVKIAKKCKLSITARGAGTSLVGNSLNSGILLDLKNFDKIKIQKNIVQVGAGTIKGILDKKLMTQMKFFPPNPSVGPYCSIGGMIGNNASGSRSLKYGSVIHNITSVTFVDGNGKKITLPQDKKTSKKIFELAKRLDYGKIPKVTKNSSGYRLDLVKSLEDSHKVMAGSEGTLGIILTSKIKIRPIPKKRILFVIEYETEIKAAEDCSHILTTLPTAIEFVDRKIMENIPQKFKSTTTCLLFVEYDTKIPNIKKRLKKLTKGTIVKTFKDDSEIQMWWKFRDSSLYYSSKSIKNKIPHIIEDATVPVERLPELFLLIDKINKRFHTRSIAYGHAGNGNIHVRLISEGKMVKTLIKIADEYFDKVIKMGGTITGEHGDGLARSEYVKKQYGPTNYRIFKELKNQFDPQNILNPGKIITSKTNIIKN